MGTATVPDPVKLFVAMTSRPDVRADEASAALTGRFGPVDNSYGPIRFGFTDYYESEMGTHLTKTYLTFQTPVVRESLAEIKVFTNNLERQYAASGRRTINLDPGYLANDKLVLASTKDFFHRIYLSHGIFAEVTLHYRKGMYRYFSWTFPDYRDPAFIEFLERVRARHVKAIRDSRENRMA